jgi:catechol 2,3-dioxygenase-like lactoylglutathione lyase family enzyme
LKGAAMNVEHIGIYAQDSAALAEWYADVLDLREIRRIEKEGRPPVVFLQGERGAVIEILPTDVESDTRDLKRPGYTHLGIVVDDLVGEQERLAARGVKVSGVRTTSNGWTIGYFEDPEGNILELVQH